MIVADNQASYEMFRSLNLQQKLNRTTIKDNSESVTEVYHYSSELAIFNFANSDYITKHEVDEYFVVLNLD